MPELKPEDLVALAPALVLAGGGLVVLLLACYLKGEDRRALPPLALFTALLALGAGVFVWGQVAAPLVALGRTVLVDRFAVFMTEVIAGATALTILLSIGYDERRGLLHGEYYGLILLAAAGMAALVASEHLVTLFVAFETFSIAVYALAAIGARVPAAPPPASDEDGSGRTSARKSAEAGLKYFIYGSFSSAFLLYGIALVYGATGSLSLSEILNLAAQGVPSPHLFWTGLILILAGGAFKVGAVPFHGWVPDVYEGAPTPVTAFMASAVKVAAFALLGRVVVLASALDPAGWQAAAWAIAALSIIFGNVLALVQQNLKRMLAYSSIAHTGYMLLALVSASGTGDLAPIFAALPFYLVVYAAMNLGAFGAIIACGDVERVDDLKGLVYRRPRIAAALTLFLVSLGGVPLTAGFVGKFLLFRSAIQQGLVGLAVVGILGSLVSFYYYLRPVVAMITRPGPDEARTHETGYDPWGVHAAVLVSAILVAFLGVLPDALIRAALASARSIF